MPLSREEILARKQELIDRFGEWTAHNIDLGYGITTRTPDIRDTGKLWRIMQFVSDVFGEDLSGIRALDLACLEGQYAVELAMRGADVVAIEGREGNIEKARLAGECLELENLSFHLDDVRNLSAKKYGKFDLVFCIGIFYHLDAPDVFHFARSIAECTTKWAVFDTNYALRPRQFREFGGKKYYGVSYREHKTGKTEEEVDKDVWASLDNPESFWLTRASLVNLLSDMGFKTVSECHYPVAYHGIGDRLTLFASKGAQTELRIDPDDVPVVKKMSQRPAGFVSKCQMSALERFARRIVPRAFKNFLRRLR
ncbi:MAG: methyltransferase domain-containing protein [Planctomycetota bacterium]|nr:MAG: methyltransferase domain-containing protein [Planctomycetota bacterium]